MRSMFVVFWKLPLYINVNDTTSLQYYVLSCLLHATTHKKIVSPVNNGCQIHLSRSLQKLALFD